METGGLKNNISIAFLLAACFCCSSCGASSDVPVVEVCEKENEQEPAVLSAAIEAPVISATADDDEDDMEQDISLNIMPFGVGVFSWDHLPLVSDIRCMQDNGITELYQYLRPEYTDEEITKFLEEMAEINIDVYVLDGEPEWACADNYQGMQNVLQRVKHLNEIARPGTKIKGIVFDVEPYVLDTWHNIPKQLLDEYASNVIRVREESMDGGLDILVYVCIPYSYDNMGHDRQLRTLIKESDGVMVMNYNKGNEIDNIKREAALARWYKKRMVNIYELQPGLLSQTNNSITYYNDGIEAVKENYSKLLNAYPSHDIALAYHTLDHLKILSYERQN